MAWLHRSPNSLGTSSGNSTRVALVITGRFDGFWEPALAPWDIAAGILLVREAGGFVSDFAGGAVAFESGDVVAANDRLHDGLKALLANANSD